MVTRCGLTCEVVHMTIVPCSTTDRVDGRLARNEFPWRARTARRTGDEHVAYVPHTLRIVRLTVTSCARAFSSRSRNVVLFVPGGPGSAGQLNRYPCSRSTLIVDGPRG